MLIRRRPETVSSVFPFPTEIDRMFDRLIKSTFSGVSEPFAGAPDFLPALDVSETDKHINVKAELPGVDPDKIDVNVHDDVLTISGHKEESKETKEENFFHSERRFGSFMRRIQLPTAVEPEKINARFKNGVLTITLDKAASVQPRKVKIVTD